MHRPYGNGFGSSDFGAVLPHQDHTIHSRNCELDDHPQPDSIFGLDAHGEDSAPLQQPGHVHPNVGRKGSTSTSSSMLLIGSFPMDEDYAPAQSSEYELNFSFGSGLDDHDLHQFSTSSLYTSSHSSMTPSTQHDRYGQDLDSAQPSQRLDLPHRTHTASVTEEGKEIIDRLYTTDAQLPPAWFRLHKCRVAVCVAATTTATPVDTKRPDAPVVVLVAGLAGEEAPQINVQHVEVTEEQEEGGEGVEDSSSSLKRAADVVHRALWQDPTSSVLLRASIGLRGDDASVESPGDESETQQQQQQQQHNHSTGGREAVVAVAIAYLVLGAKLSLRTAVEQMAGVLGADRVQRMSDGFKRQLMAFEPQTRRSGGAPTYNFFPHAEDHTAASPPGPSTSPPDAPPPPPRALAPEPQQQQEAEHTPPAAIKVEKGLREWTAISSEVRGLDNQMVVLSADHPALPAESPAAAGGGSSGGSASGTAPLLSPPASSQQRQSAASPIGSPAPVLSPPSSSLSSNPASPNPDCGGSPGKRPLTDSDSVDTPSSKAQPPSKRARGPYRCGRCGQPKRGHKCPEGAKGQDGPTAVSTPNTNSLPSCPSTPATTTMVAVKVELPPSSSAPSSSSALAAAEASSSSGGTSSSAKASPQLTSATKGPDASNPGDADNNSSSSSNTNKGDCASDTRGPASALVGGVLANAQGGSQANTSSSPTRASKPSYEELLRKLELVTQERDFFRKGFYELKNHPQEHFRSAPSVDATVAAAAAAATTAAAAAAATRTPPLGDSFPAVHQSPSMGTTTTMTVRASPSVSRTVLGELRSPPPASHGHAVAAGPLTGQQSPASAHSPTRVQFSPLTPHSPQLQQQQRPGGQQQQQQQQQYGVVPYQSPQHHRVAQHVTLLRSPASAAASQQQQQQQEFEAYALGSPSPSHTPSRAIPGSGGGGRPRLASAHGKTYFVPSPSRSQQQQYMSATNANGFSFPTQPFHPGHQSQPQPQRQQSQASLLQQHHQQHQHQQQHQQHQQQHQQLMQMQVLQPYSTGFEESESPPSLQAFEDLDQLLYDDFCQSAASPTTS